MYELPFFSLKTLLRAYGSSVHISFGHNGENIKSKSMEKYQYHIFSPYRVCPLGAHVDHQHGLVTGFAIDKGVDLWFNVTNTNRTNDTNKRLVRLVKFVFKI